MIVDEQGARVVLAVPLRGARVTLRAVINAIRSLDRQRTTIRHGEQSLQRLNLQNRQLETVDLPDPDLKQFRHAMKRYAVDFSVMRDKDSGKYTVYFKGQDLDRVQQGLKECLRDYDKAHQGKRPVKEVIKEAKEEAASRAAQRSSPEKGRDTPKREEAQR